jgi:predicted RNase H-like nuclease (RuvC/YqgF family)
MKTHEKTIKEYENKNEEMNRTIENLKLKDTQSQNKIIDLEKLISSLRDENDSLMRQLQINANLNLTLAKANEEIIRTKDDVTIKRLNVMLKLNYI